MMNARKISALIVGAAMAWTAVADDPTTIFFRPEGPGGIMLPAADEDYTGPYTWDDSLLNWFSEGGTQGETGDAQAWDNDGEHVAFFVMDRYDPAAGAVVNVVGDKNLAGLQSSFTSSSHVTTIQSADSENPVTFTFSVVTGHFKTSHLWSVQNQPLSCVV